MWRALGVDRSPIPLLAHGVSAARWKDRPDVTKQVRHRLKPVPDFAMGPMHLSESAVMLRAGATGTLRLEWAARGKIFGAGAAGRIPATYQDRCDGPMAPPVDRGGDPAGRGRALSPARIASLARRRAASSVVPGDGGSDDAREAHGAALPAAATDAPRPPAPPSSPPQLTSPGFGAPQVCSLVRPQAAHHPARREAKSKA